MKGGTQAAMAIGIGYLLGRRRKMRMATVLAAAAATGGLGGIGGAALKRGAKLLGSTEMLSKVAPQFGEIADTVRGDLLDAGKSAAAAAVNGRIESLTDSLHERAETIRNPAAAAAKTGDAVRGAGRRGRKVLAGDEAAGPDDEADVQQDEERPDLDDVDEADDEMDDEERAPRRRRAPVSRARR